MGWALDLITPVDEWKDCVAHLVGDLLIVRDFAAGSALVAGASATRWRAWRERFFSSGTVSGGRKDMRKGPLKGAVKSGNAWTGLRK